MKESLSMAYPEDFDEECRSVCDAMNAIDGLQTFESCCGHGVRPFRVHFDTHRSALIKLLAVLDGGGFWPAWVVEVKHALSSIPLHNDTVVFTLIGPAIGTDAIETSEKLATALLWAQQENS